MGNRFSNSRRNSTAHFSLSFGSSLPSAAASYVPSRSTAEVVGSPLMLKEGMKPSDGSIYDSLLATGNTFAIKKDALEKQLRHMHRDSCPPLVLRLRRERAFEESMEAFEKVGANQLKGPLMVSFVNEEGKDDGGLSRHWFEVIARAATCPSRGLFTIVVGDQYIYQLQSDDHVTEKTLRELEFLGKVFGKAVFDGYIVPMKLSSVFFKKMLGQVPCLEDMIALDSKFYDSLAWILENDVTDLGMFFVTDEEQIEVADVNGEDKITRKVVSTDLIPGGSHVAVTNENKRRYVDLLTLRKLGGSTEKQMSAFMKGFNVLVPSGLIQPLHEGELEIITCGIPVIDVEDWKRHTVYKAGYSENHRIIKWFWEIVEEWDRDKRAKLLQFVTGTSMLPPEGFRGLFGSTELRPFHIQQIRDKRRLPQASTCANELWLPPYRSKQQLEQMLVTAMNEGEHFGLR